jgi:hypothetical protein
LRPFLSIVFGKAEGMTMRTHPILSSLVLGVAIVVAAPAFGPAQAIDPKDPGPRVLESPAADLPKVVIDDQQRGVLRKNVKRKPVATSDTAEGTGVAVGEAVHPSVVLERFPEIVYDEAPTLRTMQYFATERDIVIVEPAERRVVAAIE